MRQRRLRGEAFHLAGVVVAILALGACSSAGTAGGNPSAEGEDASNAAPNDAAPASASGEDAETATDDAAAQSGSAGSGSPGGSGTATANPVGGSGSSSGASGSSGSSGIGSSGGVAASDAGSGAKSGSASGSSSGSGASSGSTTGAATFTMVYSTVLTSRTYKCQGCHPGGDAPMLSFATKSTAYSDLVGVAAQGRSCAIGGEKRVVASSSATSLLYKKLAGTQDCGSRMPEANGFTPATNVSASDLALVKSWIDSGALNN